MSVTPHDAAGHMDQMYRYQRHVYDLTRRHYLLGRKTLIGELAPPSGGTVLEVGCGTASNLVEAALLYRDARLFGFDISAEMLKSAELSVARKGLSSRITLRRGDATAFDPAALFKVPAFDRIFTSYTLSMIPDWPKAIEAMVDHLAPSGSLHIVDKPCREPILPHPSARLFPPA